VQARFKNRPSNLNFYVTDSTPEPAVGGDAYKEMFNNMMAGTWRLPDAKWVFLLCAAVTVLVCGAMDCISAFSELRLPDTHMVNGSSETVRSPCLCLVRWCHRVCPPALVAAAENRLEATARRAAERIDPLATTSGCERLAWARPGDGDEPADFRRIDKIIRDKIFRFQAHAGPDPFDETPKQAQAIGTARSALRSCMKDRYRAD